jgi:hypothetical protein
MIGVMRAPSCLALLVATGCAAAVPAAAPPLSSDRPPLPARASIEAPLSDAERAWIEGTLSRLTLRQKVGQMTWIWVLGDYTSEGDSTFAEVLR